MDRVRLLGLNHTTAALEVRERLALDAVWFGVFVGGFVIFATLRFLKKRTQILQVEGR